MAQAIAQRGILRHKDPNIRLMAACSLADVMRLFAPDPPFDNDTIEEIFGLFIDQLSGLADTESSSYPKYFYLLESLAMVQTFLLLVDGGPSSPAPPALPHGCGCSVAFAADAESALCGRLSIPDSRGCEGDEEQEGGEARAHACTLYGHTHTHGRLAKRGVLSHAACVPWRHRRARQRGGASQAVRDDFRSCDRGALDQGPLAHGRGHTVHGPTPLDTFATACHTGDSNEQGAESCTFRTALRLGSIERLA